MSLITSFSRVATLLSYLGIPGSWPRKNKFKKMDKIHMFLRQQCFLLFCFRSAASIVRPSFFLHAHFSSVTSRALFPFLTMCLFRTFEINGGSKYGFCLVYGSCSFFFELPLLSMTKILLERQYFKKKLLMLRP